MTFIMKFNIRILKIEIIKSLEKNIAALFLIMLNSEIDK